MQCRGLSFALNGCRIRPREALSQCLRELAYEDLVRFSAGTRLRDA
jgi:hypothetical protein